MFCFALLTFKRGKGNMLRSKSDGKAINFRVVTASLHPVINFFPLTAHPQLFQITY